MSFAIEAVGVKKNFKNTIALDALNLKVMTGSVMGLIGENGAGKTTSMAIICGLIRPDEGYVKIFGKDVRKSGIVREAVGAYLQNSNFSPNSTVMEEMMFYSALKGVKKDKAGEECKKILKEVGLDGHMDHKIRELSHGMLQMLGVAQALIGEPKIIILDEPSSGLDPRMYHELKSLIRSIAKEKTILISSHNLDFITDVCTDAAIIHKGKIMVIDSMKKLTVHKTLEKVFLDLIER